MCEMHGFNWEGKIHMECGGGTKEEEEENEELMLCRGRKYSSTVIFSLNSFVTFFLKDFSQTSIKQAPHIIFKNLANLKNV